MKAADGLPELPTLASVIDGSTSRLWSLGAQVYVSRGSEVIAHAATGQVAIGAPLTLDHLPRWFCNSKPITSVLIAQLWEEGVLDLDAPVTEIVPEFGTGGKETITPRHLLTHTSGVTTDLSLIDVPQPWDRVLDKVCALPASRPPGTAWLYLETANWHVLAEIVRRLRGIDDYGKYVKQQVFDRLGAADCWLGMGDRAVYESYQDRQLRLCGFVRHGVMPVPHPLNDPAAFVHCLPGIGGFGPPHEFARFHESLLGRPDRPSFLRQETVDEFTRGRPACPRSTMSWGLGFKAECHGFRGGFLLYPERSFGHDGGEMLTLADPRHDLVFVIAFHVQPRRKPGRGYPGLQRQQHVVTALYRDLNLSLFDETGPARVPLMDARLDKFIASTVPNEVVVG